MNTLKFDPKKKTQPTKGRAFGKQSAPMQRVQHTRKKLILFKNKKNWKLHTWNFTNMAQSTLMKLITLFHWTTSSTVQFPVFSVKVARVYRNDLRYFFLIIFHPQGSGDIHSSYPLIILLCNSVIIGKSYQYFIMAISWGSQLIKHIARLSFLWDKKWTERIKSAFVSLSNTLLLLLRLSSGLE